MGQTWKHIALEAGELLYGPGVAAIDRELRHGPWVAALFVNPEWVGGTVVAPPLAHEILVLGLGLSPADAYRSVVSMLARGEPPVTTPEVALVLGVNRNTVRDHARRGRLPYAWKGDANTPSRFLPADVWALLVRLDSFVREDGEGVGLR